MERNDDNTRRQHVPGAPGRDNQNAVSAVAIAGSLLVVLGAILFGIFGPRITERAARNPRVAVGDVVDVASVLHLRVITRLIHNPDPPPLDDSDLDSRVERMFDMNVSLPDVPSLGYELVGVEAVELPGWSDSLQLTWMQPNPERRPGDPLGFIDLYLLRDTGQYVIYDMFSRPMPLISGDIYQSDQSDLAEFQLPSLVWSDGSMLYLACFTTEIELDSMRNLVEEQLRMGGDSADK